MKYILFSFILIAFSFGEDIEPKHICSHHNSSYRWASETSTLTQNQNKIDISFYELDIDIDFSLNIISGYVLIKGTKSTVAPPDYIELDLYNNMVVDSVF